MFKDKLNLVLGNIKRNKIIVLVSALIGIPLLAMLFFIIYVNTAPQQKKQNIQNNPPVPTEALAQQPFNIIATIPSSGQQNVFPGEIVFSFATDNEVLAPDSFSVEVTPALEYQWKDISSYPTREVKIQTLGNLQLNQTYNVTVKNTQGAVVYTWSFTTSGDQPEEASGLAEEFQQQQVAKYYPLFDYIPFANQNFSIDYVFNAPLTLEVTIKNPNVDAVKQEVNEWIQSHGVNPSTHNINYKNEF